MLAVDDCGLIIIEKSYKVNHGMSLRGRKTLTVEKLWFDVEVALEISATNQW